MGLDKVNSPTSGTITTVSLSANTWTAVATGLSNIISWELVCREGYAFDYAYEDSPTHYRTNGGTGVSKDAATTQVYARCATACTMELEFWKL